MKEYTFKQQIKHEIWSNETFTIKAESYEDAKNMFLTSIYNGNDFEYSDGNFEYLYETSEWIDEELLDENNNILKPLTQ